MYLERIEQKISDFIQCASAVPPTKSNWSTACTNYHRDTEPSACYDPLPRSSKTKLSQFAITVMNKKVETNFKSKPFTNSHYCAKFEINLNPISIARKFKLFHFKSKVFNYFVRVCTISNQKGISNLLLLPYFSNLSLKIRTNLEFSQFIGEIVETKRLRLWEKWLFWHMK